MTKRVWALSILLFGLVAGPALATTVVLGTDEQLFDQAELIAVGTVVSAGPARSGLPATEYRVRVERTLKGRGPAGELLVRVPGGVAAGGRRLVVWGVPRLRPGERTLLFLDRYPDGDYGPLHLALGAFSEVRAGNRRVALRDLSEMVDAATGKAARDPARDFARFAAWLLDRAAGLWRPADYFVREPASGLRPIGDAFTYLGSIKQRWTQFDQEQSVGWRALGSGQPGLPGGGFTEFQNALRAWNADPATNIRYRYDGTTNSIAGFQSPDGVNAILFEDPNHEVGGTFLCSSPGNGFGVLALGGTWIGSADGGRNAVKIEEGDIIVNDGAGCWFSTAKRAEQVYGHELGHTLGLGHSCGDSASGDCSDSLKNDALMRASAHADDRGALLNADDQAGIFTLYSASGSPSGKSFYTVTPCRILDTRAGSPAASGTRYWIQIAGSCGIPSSATAVAANATVVGATGSGFATLWPGDLPQPGTSTINFRSGQVLANNAVVALATDGFGDISYAPFVSGNGSVHLILDVSGYFAP